MCSFYGKLLRPTAGTAGDLECHTRTNHHSPVIASQAALAQRGRCLIELGIARSPRPPLPLRHYSTIGAGLHSRNREASTRLIEQIRAGALRQAMYTHPGIDGAGITWTLWGTQ